MVNSKCSVKNCIIEVLVTIGDGGDVDLIILLLLWLMTSIDISSIVGSVY